MSTYFFQFSASLAMFTSVKLYKTIHKGHATYSFVVFRGHFPATSHKRFGAKASFNFSVTLLDICYLSTSNTLVHFTLSRNACKLRDPPLPITSFATYRVALISCSIKAQVIFEVILAKKMQLHFSVHGAYFPSLLSFRVLKSGK